MVKKYMELFKVPICILGCIGWAFFFLLIFDQLTFDPQWLDIIAAQELSYHLRQEIP